MAYSWKSAGLFIMWMVVLLPAHADDPTDTTSVVRDLGTIPRANSDQRLVHSLFALARATPDDRLVAVEARIKSADDESLTYARYLYDRKGRHLLVLLRTVRQGTEFYHYSSYTETDPADFKQGLPIRAQKGYPKVAQSSKKSEVRIPVCYPDIPRLSEWP
jgi:hypothetical protein